MSSQPLTSSRVEVVVRVRPLLPREDQEEDEICVQTSRGKCVELIKKDITMGSTTLPGTGQVWEFDSVFNERCSQLDIFKRVGTPAVQHALAGYHTCIFAYGQTGSGKTYTMEGDCNNSTAQISNKTDGLILNLSRELFKEAYKLKAASQAAASSSEGNRTSKWDFQAEVSHIEIYNEKVRCLLQKSKEPRIREHPVTGPYVDGATKCVVRGPDDILKLLKRSAKTRTIASTRNNDRSSRSHGLYVITFTQVEAIQDTTTERESRITLVDLAGSERANTAENTSKDSVQINQSLTTLGKVVNALAETDSGSQQTDYSSPSRRHIPYRDSSLTWLLKESLGGNSKTVMLCTLPPTFSNYELSLSTLRFAERAKCLTTKPIINEDPSKKRIRLLMEEVDLLKQELNSGQGQTTGSQPTTSGTDNYATMSLENKLSETQQVLQNLKHEWNARLSQFTNIQKHKVEELENVVKRQQSLGNKMQMIVGTLQHLHRTGDNSEGDRSRRQSHELHKIREALEEVKTLVKSKSQPQPQLPTGMGVPVDMSGSGTEVSQFEIQPTLTDAATVSTHADPTVSSEQTPSVVQSQSGIYETNPSVDNITSQQSSTSGVGIGSHHLLNNENVVVGGGSDSEVGKDSQGIQQKEIDISQRSVSPNRMSSAGGKIYEIPTAAEVMHHHHQHHHQHQHQHHHQHHHHQHQHQYLHQPHRNEQQSLQEDDLVEQLNKSEHRLQHFQQQALHSGELVDVIQHQQQQQHHHITQPQQTGGWSIILKAFLSQFGSLEDAFSSLRSKQLGGGQGGYLNLNALATFLADAGLDHLTAPFLAALDCENNSGLVMFTDLRKVLIGDILELYPNTATSPPVPFEADITRSATSTSVPTIDVYEEYNNVRHQLTKSDVPNPEVLRLTEENNFLKSSMLEQQRETASLKETMVSFMDNLNKKQQVSPAREPLELNPKRSVSVGGVRGRLTSPLPPNIASHITNSPVLLRQENEYFVQKNRRTSSSSTSTNASEICVAEALPTPLERSLSPTSKDVSFVGANESYSRSPSRESHLIPQTTTSRSPTRSPLRQHKEKSPELQQSVDSPPPFKTSTQSSPLERPSVLVTLQKRFKELQTQFDELSSEKELLSDNLLLTKEQLRDEKGGRDSAEEKLEAAKKDLNELRVQLYRRTQQRDQLQREQQRWESDIEGSSREQGRLERELVRQQELVQRASEEESKLNDLREDHSYVYLFKIFNHFKHP